jgi:tetratricopeptide (TPR) repeat protein
MKNFLRNAALSLGVLAAMCQAGWAQTPEVDAGMSSFYQEKWDDAIKNFQGAVIKEPQNSLAMAYLLHAYYKKKDIGTVVNQMEQQAVAKGNDPTAQAQLGMAYFLKGMVIPAVLEEALTEFKNALKDDAKNSMAYTGMGMVYFQKRQIPKAKGFFVKALRNNPHDVMALDRLGNILMVDDKKPEQALELYERIVVEVPSYPDGHYFMGSALFDLKRYEDAIVSLQKAKELDPKGLTQGFDAATLLGDCYLKLNKGPEAIAAFEVAQKMQPGSTYVKIKLDKAKNPGKKP